MARLELKPERDGLGYYYGQYVDDDGNSVRVDILPPRSEAKPAYVFDNSAADPTHWIVYADGEEIARIEWRDDLEASVIAAIEQR